MQSVYGQETCTKDIGTGEVVDGPVEVRCLSSEARIVNRGTIQLDQNFGIIVESLISATARNIGIVRQSTARTGQDSTHPIGVYALAGGNSIVRQGNLLDKNAKAFAHNSGTIEVLSTVSAGLQATVDPLLTAGRDPANADATWKATAQNTGTVTVSADLDTVESFGIVAEVKNSHYGDAEIINSGTVKATGTGAIGLLAKAGNTGQAKVRVTGGSIITGTEDTKTGGSAIEAEVGIGSLTDPEDDADVDIVVSGDSKIIVHRASGDTTNYPAAINAVVHSKTMGNAHAKVEIRDSALVQSTGSWAINFYSGTNSRSTLRVAGRRSTSALDSAVIRGSIAFGEQADVFELDRGSVFGNVYFYDGNDRMKINNWGRATWTLDFGDGDDELIVSVTRGARLYQVNNLETLRIDKGNLIFSGHLNLGPSGVVTVRDASRLVFEIWQSSGQIAHGSITAGELKFEGASPEIFAQFSPYTDQSIITALQELLKQRHTTEMPGGLPVLKVTSVTSDGTPITMDQLIVKSVSDSGRVAVTGVMLSDGKVRFLADKIVDIGKVDLSTREPGSGDTTGTGGSGSSGGSAVMGLGLLAMLLSQLTVEEEPEAQSGGYSAISSPLAKGASQKRFQFYDTESDRGPWMRLAQNRFTSYGTTNLEASGNRIGWNFHQSGGHFLRTELVPNISVAPAGGRHGSATGQQISLTSAWQGKNRYVSLGVSHGQYDIDSRFFDSVTRGWLTGQSEFTATQGNLTAGFDTELNDIKLSATASLFAGKIRQESYEAENTVMTAQMPEHEQRYSGMKLSMSMRSKKWFELTEGMSFKPHLKVGVTRTRSTQPNAVQIHQSDKAGVLSFSSPMMLHSVPRSLNMLSIGADVKPSGIQRGTWRLGFASMEVDGDAEHAAIAAYHMRF